MIPGPIEFITEVLRNPDDRGRPFELYPIQSRFLEETLTLTPDGRLPYPEIVYSCKKKSGKTATAAMSMLYVLYVLAGEDGEGYCVANDLDQSTGRVFRACARIIKASPIIKPDAKILSTKILFKNSGSTIEAIAADYAGAAGANPNFIVFDELWAYTSEGSRRLWDEMVPVPTRNVSARMTTTYAGFEGESVLLEELYKRGLRGEEVA